MSIQPAETTAQPNVESVIAAASRENSAVRRARWRIKHAHERAYEKAYDAFKANDGKVKEDLERLKSELKEAKLWKPAVKAWRKEAEGKKIRKSRNIVATVTTAGILAFPAANTLMIVAGQYASTLGDDNWARLAVAGPAMVIGFALIGCTAFYGVGGSLLMPDQNRRVRANKLAGITRAAAEKLTV